MNLHCQGFWAGVVAVPATSASFTLVNCVVITAFICIFAHFKDTFTAGEYATLTCFTFQLVDNWIGLLSPVGHDQSSSLFILSIFYPLEILSVKMIY
jgi:hypothetical protein